MPAPSVETGEMNNLDLNELTLDELASLRQTNEWLQADPSRLKKAMALARKPIEFAYSKVPESVRESIANAILGVLTSVQNGTSNFLSTEGVRDRLVADHGPLESREDFFRLGVDKLDQLALELIKKSKNACTAEGAATGLAGLPGIVVDIPALYGLLFRMISQVSAVYGYPGQEQAEKMHMMKVLDIGHQMEPKAKRAGMLDLGKIQNDMLLDQATLEVQKFAVEKSLQTMARNLGLILTQRKLAQSVALIGSVIGAGVNRQLAGEVGEAAFHAYRRRHFIELAYLRRTGVLKSTVPGGQRSAPASKLKLPTPPSYT